MFIQCWFNDEKQQMYTQRTDTQKKKIVEQTKEKLCEAHTK